MPAKQFDISPNSCHLVWCFVCWACVFFFFLIFHVYVDSLSQSVYLLSIQPVRIKIKDWQRLLPIILNIHKTLHWHTNIKYVPKHGWTEIFLGLHFKCTLQKFDATWNGQNTKKQKQNGTTHCKLNGITMNLTWIVNDFTPFCVCVCVADGNKL